MNSKGEISLFTILTSLVLIMVTVIFVNGAQPLLSALFFSTGTYSEGSIGRLLLEAIPLAPILGAFYLLFRQG